jgi:hypothetical protein
MTETPGRPSDSSDEFRETFAAIFGPDELSTAQQDYLRGSGLI